MGSSFLYAFVDGFFNGNGYLTELFLCKCYLAVESKTPLLIFVVANPGVGAGDEDANIVPSVLFGYLVAEGGADYGAGSRRLGKYSGSPAFV